MAKINPHILEGSISKGVISLSAPIILAMFFHSLLGIVDTFWVGKISSVAVAAVSLSWPVLFGSFALMSGIATGSTALVARFVGAKDFGSATKVAQNSVFLGIVLSVFLTIVGLFSVNFLFSFLGASGSLLDYAASYTRIIFYGTVFSTSLFILGSILRGEGDTKTPMKIGITINVVNMLLDPVFMFTFGWGVAGAALSTVFSNVLGVIFYVLYFMKGKSLIQLTYHNFKYSTKFIYDILFIGVPASLRNVTNAVGVFFTLKFIASYGAAAVAAYGIAFRVENFGVMPAIAIALSTVTIVGQNVGANNFDRAKMSGWVSTGIGAVLMALFGVFVFIFAPSIIKLFNNEPEVVAIGSEVLKIKSPAFLFSALIFSTGSAFQAFGKSHYSLIITIFRVASMLALIYWFNNVYGLVGVWWGIVFSGILSGLINIIWYKLYQPKPALKAEENLL